MTQSQDDSTKVRLRNLDALRKGKRSINRQSVWGSNWTLCSSQGCPSDFRIYAPPCFEPARLKGPALCIPASPADPARFKSAP